MFLSAVYAGLFMRRELIHLALNMGVLNSLPPILLIILLVWVVTIVGTYRSLRPRQISLPFRIGGALLVCALVVMVAVPLTYVSRLAGAQKELVSSAFKEAEEIRSETKPGQVAPGNPWAGRDRVNVLLLGGDGKSDRTGIRTDTVMLASISTKTGDTALISLPRNLERVPFPKNSKLAKAYPNGIFDPGREFKNSAEELEYMLTAIYENVPQQHPGLLKSDNPGADTLKLAVGAALGQEIDYYVLLNIDGFEKLVDALGGITVNVNEPVPLGGDEASGTPPLGWISPGPNKHLDGPSALWYTRTRWGTDDYDRMRRQRCAIHAIIRQASPSRLLTRYEKIADASRNLAMTDVPRSLLPAFVDLAVKVKTANISNLVFDSSLIKHSDPDYNFIRAKTREAIEAGEHKDEAARAPIQAAGRGLAVHVVEAGNETGSNPATTLDDACAYRPR
ncbi:LCP family protein [Actinopolymorpha pittospori]|uniref:LCP family protein required for cell wall assembly n=1 Tax=Actinopolymorpha pittospori TaxID=648752 RepID=A0A927MPR1_9ACTN|nr:LCP family protein [Actinopolymorpha pittospori]MBE1604121.1 LCP family protein required for cell wall assembly [Actinopolymorpha pittospori]